MLLFTFFPRQEYILMTWILGLHFLINIWQSWTYAFLGLRAPFLPSIISVYIVLSLKSVCVWHGPGPGPFRQSHHCSTHCQHQSNVKVVILKKELFHTSIQKDLEMRVECCQKKQRCMKRKVNTSAKSLNPGKHSDDDTLLPLNKTLTHWCQQLALLLELDGEKQRQN